MILCALPGCTLFGLGVGAATPTTKTEIVEIPASHADRGDVVRLRLDDGTELYGAVGNSTNESVEIQQPYRGKRWDIPTNITVPIDRIRTMRRSVVSRRRSTDALRGLLIGFIADLSAAALVGIVAGAYVALKDWRMRF
jgi:hypothetical protein